MRTSWLSSTNHKPKSRAQCGPWQEPRPLPTPPSCAQQHHCLLSAPCEGHRAATGVVPEGRPPSGGCFWGSVPEERLALRSLQGARAGSRQGIDALRPWISPQALCFSGGSHLVPSTKWIAASDTPIAVQGGRTTVGEQWESPPFGPPQSHTRGPQRPTKAPLPGGKGPVRWPTPVLLAFLQPRGLRKHQAAGPSGFRPGREVGFDEGKTRRWVNRVLRRVEMLWNEAVFLFIFCVLGSQACHGGVVGACCVRLSRELSRRTI